MRKSNVKKQIVISNVPETSNASVIETHSELAKLTIRDPRREREYIIPDMLHAEQPETYLSTREYAKKHGISQTTVRSQIRRKKLEGRLKKCQCGNNWLVKDKGK